MPTSSFPNFERELAEHSEGLYHVLYGRVERAPAIEWFSQRLIGCPKSYLDFIVAIGPGRFFAGSLHLFSVDPEGELDVVTQRLPEETQKNFFAFGYDGTTEGCYCLSRSGRDEAVYWHNWGLESTIVHHKSFSEWIESQPKELFRNGAYTGYKKIKDISSILEVIRERAAFEVRLLHHDRKLTRPPGRESAVLPRYHRIVCGVRKLQPSRLTQLTFKLLRLGSSVGSDNVAYLTIDVSEIRQGEEVQVERFVFDPFNLPFENMAVDYTPEIDLNSPRRVSYAEIKEYL